MSAKCYYIVREHTNIRVTTIEKDPLIVCDEETGDELIAEYEDRFPNQFPRGTLSLISVEDYHTIFDGPAALAKSRARQGAALAAQVEAGIRSGDERI